MSKNEIVVLDVGHGNCTVLKDNNTVIVIDAGPKNTLLEYLTQNGIDCIDVVLISHADTDHIAGLIAVLASKLIIVNHVRLNTDSLKGSQIWDDLLALLDELDRKGKIDFQVTLSAGSGEYFSCGDLSLEILAPSKYLAARGPGSSDRRKRRITNNTISSVIRVNKDDKPIILLPGDIDAVGLSNIVEYDIDIHAPTLVFPHHGGSPGDAEVSEFTEAITSAVEPMNIIFSIGRGRYKTPRPEIIKTIFAKTENVRCVCTQLSENCSDSLPDVSPDYAAHLYSSGCENKKCCGGSVVISPDDGSIVHPPLGKHIDFISHHAGKALCK